MSDQPLFQGQDEQEKIFAPQQLPDGSTGEQAADIEDGQRVDDVPFVPGAATGLGTAGVGPSSGAYPLSGVVPLGGGLPAATPADDAEIVNDHDDER